jgi:hypothetical protein
MLRQQVAHRHMAFASALVISPVKLTSLNTEAMYADMDVNGIASKRRYRKRGSFHLHIFWLATLW